MRLVGLLCVLLLAAACGEEPPGGGRASDDPVAGDYVSDSVPGPGFRGDGAPRLRMTLSGGEIRFSADCNTFFGSATWADGRFSARDLGGTEMGCPDDAQARDEWLLDFFGRADRIERSGTDIALHAGSTTIWFVPADEVGEGTSPAVPLEGTQWTLTGIAEYDGDSGSVSSVPAGVVATVRISSAGSSGRLEFHSGCNSGGGRVEVGERTLRLTQVVSTLMGCTGARAEVERSVLRVLQGEVAWSIAGRELRLRKDGHELVYRVGEE